ncbi:MAG: endonuclease MutS2 [Nitrospiraceae bacterium]
MKERNLSQETERVLEWDRVLDMLARQARSAIGAERCRTLFLETELTAARTRLQETAEMVSLGERGDPFPSLGFPDIREALGRVVKGASMEVHELRDVSLVLGVAFESARYLKRHREQAPALCALHEPLEILAPLHQVKTAIDGAIGPEGHIKESATPDLRRLTHHAQELKQQMRHRLDVILESRRFAEVLQERYFAQREGRYVVPVKSEMRSKIPGIVHDVSASGATVFLEPRELVELNNTIKVAELELEREVRRILQELSVRVGIHAPTILAGLEVMADLDSVAAKAAFSHLVKGHPVSLNEKGRVMLRQARHPLLVLAKEQVVANDIVLDESARVLVISGPNTGGKTVTLKMIGLAALMARAGLEFPCEANSEMAVFPDVYADIGDAQDLAKDLSSFSAHIDQMVQLLGHIPSDTGASASEVRPPSVLALIDEPVTSTDPVEGAALAEALLLRLASRGVKVVATTHYNSLKALGQATPGFLNASVGFDVNTLSPTYRLIMNVPGGSSAIEIAGRLGMDESILEHALSLLNREDRTLERLLGDLQEKQRRLDQEVTRVAELQQEAERSARESAEIAERLRASEYDERKGVKKKLTAELMRARAEVQEVLESLKRERAVAKAKDAKRRLSDLEDQARTALSPPGESVPVETLTIGDRVELSSLGTIGTLLEEPLGKKRVRVRVGETEVSVAVSGLLGMAGSRSEERAPRTRRWEQVRPRHEPSDTGASHVLDLRGKSAEEALEQTVATLDQAVLAGAVSLRIIHGHGTGRLRAVIREHLGQSPYVTTFRAGERAEGGDGVTIAELK